MLPPVSQQGGQRDSNWIDGVANGSETEDWQAFVHNCSQGKADDFTPANLVKVGVEATAAQRYAACYDEHLQRFGLERAEDDDTNLSVTGNLASTTYLHPQDPMGPTWFKRIITLEKVPSTDTNYNGLQLLINKQNLTNSNDYPALQTGDVEGKHFVKVRVTISWQDFDQPWTIAMTTLLTNWREQ